MLDKDTVAGWRGHELVDRDGDKIGKIGDVYLDSSNDRPEWVTVKTGLFGRRETFVPIGEAASEGEMVRVPFEKEHVKDAPGVEPDAELTPEQETELYRHYGLDPSSSQSSASGSGSGEEHDAERGATEGHDAEGGDTEGDDVEARGTPPSGDEGQTTQRADADRGEPSEPREATNRRDPEGRAGEPQGRSREQTPRADDEGPTGGAESARDDLGSGAKVHKVGEEPTGGEEGDGVHGHLRLKKYVVKEEVRIPVEREETRIERE